MALSPAVIGAIDDLLPPLLDVLARIEWVQRHMHPAVASRLADELAPGADAVAAPLRALEEAPWPGDLTFMRDRLVAVAQQARELITTFVEAARPSVEPIEVLRVIRRFAPLQETLYPLAGVFDPVSRWFLEPARRDDDALVARLRGGAFCADARVGVAHASNDRGTRGGFSLYVPEDADGTTPMPLVVALHGGGGHGRDFLWSWLRDARARGVMVLAPTSRDRTWSIMGREDVDAEPLTRMVAFVSERYPVDATRVLLTGMSDGATYTLLCGLRQREPFTHLAPSGGILHPMLMAGEGLERARGRRIYLIHGALDWMFPVRITRMAREMLEAVGAQLVYREIEDLAHTYPRDENPAILDWLSATA